MPLLLFCRSLNCVGQWTPVWNMQTLTACSSVSVFAILLKSLLHFCLRDGLSLQLTILGERAIECNAFYFLVHFVFKPLLFCNIIFVVITFPIAILSVSLRLWISFISVKKYAVLCETILMILLFFFFLSSTLSKCAHAVVAMLYPFTWQHTYIPVLPASMIDIVCSPTPFLIGILSCSLPLLNDLPIEEVGKLVFFSFNQ